VARPHVRPKRSLRDAGSFSVGNDSSSGLWVTTVRSFTFAAPYRSCIARIRCSNPARAPLRPMISAELLMLSKCVNPVDVIKIFRESGITKKQSIVSLERQETEELAGP